MATQNLSPQGYNFGMDPTNNNPFWKDPEVVGQYVKYIDYRQNGNTFVIYYIDNNNEEHTVCRFTITGGQDGVTYTPHIEETENGYTLSWTNDGGLPNPETITISNGTDGQDGQDGQDGTDGVNGVTFTPNVTVDNDEVTISWTNDGDLPNPEPVTYKTTPQPTAADIGKFLKVAGTSAAPVLMFGEVEAVPSPNAKKIYGSFDGENILSDIDIVAYNYTNMSRGLNGTNIAMTKQGNNPPKIEIPISELGLARNGYASPDSNFIYDTDGQTKLNVRAFYSDEPNIIWIYTTYGADKVLIVPQTITATVTETDGTETSLQLEYGGYQYDYTPTQFAKMLVKNLNPLPQTNWDMQKIYLAAGGFYFEKGIDIGMNKYYVRSVNNKLGNSYPYGLTLSLADYNGEITKADILSELKLYAIERDMSIWAQKLTEKSWDTIFPGTEIYTNVNYDFGELVTSITAAGDFYLRTNPDKGVYNQYAITQINQGTILPKAIYSEAMRITITA